MQSALSPIRFIDSHTAGEPTRVITEGIPALGNGTLDQRLQVLQNQDWFRRCVIGEPRGWDALVGAILCEPNDPVNTAGVIFINNAGYLGMCGHGMMGVAVTLYRLQRIGLGKHHIETPVGVVEVDLRSPHQVAIKNVPSYRLHQDVAIDVDGIGSITGDVAWGGNWFFLAHQTPAPIAVDNISHLSDAAQRIRGTLVHSGITGTAGAEIDHIEFFQPPQSTDAHSRNFVYCPGGAYDRSPCGTGTSAKLACLAADGKLQPGETWVQESIVGSRFAASYQWHDATSIAPTVVGEAFVCSEGTLLRESADPFRSGISESTTP